jgi:hypothetical protein
LHPRVAQIDRQCGLKKFTQIVAYLSIQYLTIKIAMNKFYPKAGWPFTRKSGALRFGLPTFHLSTSPRMKHLIAFFLLLSVTAPLAAQSESRPRNISIELNPLAYAFGGWSIGTAYRPKKIPHWVFNAGAYGFKFPEVFVEQIAGNEGVGFDVRLRLAMTLGTDYYPWREDRQGFAFGMSAVLGAFEITHPDEVGRARYNSLYLVPRASFTWYPWKGLYLMPWAGVELHNQLGGTTAVGTKTFEPIKFQFSPNLSIGYSF